jgi:hypothetical protein
MIEPTLFIGASLSILSAAIYFYVGRVLGQRHPTSSESNTAWYLFITWWYALGVSTLSGAVLSILGALGIVGVALFTTFTLVNLLAICVALHGLLFYLIYLFTGNKKWLGPLTAFYIVYYILLVYYILASDPVGVSVRRWSATLEYQNQIRGPLFLIALLLLVVPQIVGSLAYFTLYFRVKTITQKYRILLVSWSIIVWFMSSLIASLSGLSQFDAWQVLSRLIALTASLTILFAYQPPSWVKQRFHVTSIAEEAA